MFLCHNGFPILRFACNRQYNFSRDRRVARYQNSRQPGVSAAALRGRCASGTPTVRRAKPAGMLMGWDKIRRCTECGAGNPEQSSTCVRCGSARLGVAQSPWPTDLKKLSYPYRAIPYPPCPVDGSVRAILTGHLATKFLLPEKCSGCQFGFEGDCMRANTLWPPTPQDLESMPTWTFVVLDFDFGTCDVPSTTRVAEVRTGEDRRQIPEKCVGCAFLAPGFRCHRYYDWSGLPCPLDYSGIDLDLLKSLAN